MTEMFDEASTPSATEEGAESEAVTTEDVASTSNDADGSSEQQPAEENPALAKFTSCRWHATQDNGGAAYCSHRDVIPYAGMNGFNPEAWCPDCEFFKVRRTVKKRNAFDIDDY